MKNCVLDETRYWIAFQLLCMHACGLLFLYLSHSSGPWKVDILFCTATVLLNPFPPLNLIFLTASFLNPLLLLLQFSCQWKAVSHWLFSGKRTQCLIGVNENYWGYFNWFCLRPLSLHQFGCLSNGKDKANLFSFLPTSLINPFTELASNMAASCQEAALISPSAAATGPTLSMFWHTGWGEKGEKLWLVSLSTSVTMAAKFPMTSFSLALPPIHRARLKLLGEVHWPRMDDARCIYKKGWRFAHHHRKCTQSLLVCKHGG